MSLVKKILILFSCSLCLVSCEEEIRKKLHELTNKPNVENINNNGDFTERNIHFAKILIKLPHSFNEFTSKDLTNKVTELEENTTAYIESIKKFESSKYGFKLFIDTLDFSSQIMFFGQEHLFIDKQTSGQYLTLLERQLENEWIPQGISFKRLESNFFSGKTVGILKIKYEINSNNITSFKTQYIVTTNKNTFGILVNKSDSEDFQNLITSMKLK